MLRLPVRTFRVKSHKLSWALVKSCVAPKNDTFKIKQLKELTLKTLSDLKINNWRNAGKHIKKVEEFWKIDFAKLSPIVEDFIINLTDSDYEVCDEEVDSYELTGEYNHLT